MSYKTVKEHAEEQFEEKKSIFIGRIARVENEEEARSFINAIKSKHKEARHNVFSYVIGENMEIQRYSDDGEPQGTGGIPVLEVIKRNEITDAVVVVTRYFGGTLLGAAGLIRAYTKAASMAIKSAGVIEKVRAVKMLVHIDYDALGKIQYHFNAKGWQIINTDYSDVVAITILSLTEEYDNIKSSLIDITNNKISIIKKEEGIYFKEGDTILDR
ncbi:YigZ family protein [Clostridium sp. 19966]|uniref:YigZ family protein n=1 Tax=Clostridium sp. 19966 TaxID=2768166 RepID=UPI0028DE362F|nr:YigZ family protein [Clostridium sp. 19966]MDT8717461.1 YigZ family protein [Clostridium sp. 19966]